MTIQEIVSDIISKKKAAGTPVDSLYFVGCGGSFAVHAHAKYFVERESKTLKTGLFTSNEFVHAMPVSCTASSIVVACSMRGTAETARAVECAAKAGAATVSFYVEESEMTRASEYTIQYNSISVDEHPIQTTNASQTLMLAAEVLHQLEGYAGYDAMMAGFKGLDEVYRNAKTACKPEAQRFANECKDDKIIYVMGGGPMTATAYIFSICNLMEMQWIHSPTVNSGELLHGPFEVVDKELPMVCLLNTGRTRPVDMRAMKFLQTYGQRLYVMDADALGFDGIDASVREYFPPVVFTELLQNVFLDEMATVRNHPIKTRRYMWKVEY